MFRSSARARVVQVAALRIPPIISILVCAAIAQPTRFEVASIRLSPDRPPSQAHSLDGLDRIDRTPVGLTMRSVTLKSALAWAYSVSNYQVFGPSALTTARYDVIAKAPTFAEEAVFRTMLQTLLTERFKLSVHRETRTVAVNFVVVSKRGGFNKAVSKETGPSEVKVVPTGLLARRATIGQFADVLGLALTEPVIDKTGISGVYDFNLDMTAYATRDSEPRDMFAAALEDQLGLKLQASKAALPVLVVDRVDVKTATNN